LRDNLECLNEVDKRNVFTQFRTKTVIKIENNKISYSPNYIYLGD